MSQGLTIPPDLEAEMTPRVQAHVQMLHGRVTQLEQELADLRRELKKIARFGLQPAQPPAIGAERGVADTKPTPPKTRRQRGGQPGHQKHERPLIPEDDRSGTSC